MTLLLFALQDESEDYVAHMWRRVALMSKETAEQLLSYQNAIEALSVSTVYLIWVYTHLFCDGSNSANLNHI